MEAEPLRIAWIGLGVMGRPMALRLLAARRPLTVFNRSRPAVEECLRAGAREAASPADAARDADIVFTMLPDTPDVESVARGEGGVLGAARRGSVIVDMSTISPSATEALARDAAARGVAWLDAPVTGGDAGARNGSLIIMCGGEEAAFRRCRPLFEQLGTKAVRVGPSGSGQRLKLCNNVVVALNLEAMCEGLGLAMRAGLDPAAALEVLSSGAAASWALSTLAPRALAGDFAPGFKIRLHQKDLRLAIEEAGRLGMTLPGAEMVSGHFARAIRDGDADLGTQALIRRFAPDPASPPPDRP